VPPTAAPDMPGGRGPGWPAPEQRQPPRGPADCSPIRAPSTCARSTCSPPGRLAHRPVPLRNPRCHPRCHPRCAHRRQPGRQRHCRGLRTVERTLADCQRQLARYRAALDAGAINFLEVWTSRSSPRRPLVRTAPTRREPLGAHHYHLPDRPAPSRPLPGATRPGAVGASSADAFAREAHRSAMLCPRTAVWLGDRT
jgi:hypothetical protein